MNDIFKMLKRERKKSTVHVKFCTRKKKSFKNEDEIKTYFRTAKGERIHYQIYMVMLK